eukprot:m.320682 g.320682  ORF g.320682 m.320682 type:complete len:263 (+) comp24329_c0_seq1:54-842(+)
MSCAPNSVITDEFWAGGPRPGAFYPLRQPQAAAAAAPADPRTHTLNPIVTGTSVLGVRFQGGVVLAADTLGSYGSLARFREVSRFHTLCGKVVVGASGDIADFQAVKTLLEEVELEFQNGVEQVDLTPKAVHSFLTRVLYNRRSKFDPLWNTLVVGGMQDGQSYLGFVDKVGVAYTDPTIATGYGAHIALPLMRTAYEENPNMTEEEAVALLEKCLRVLFYRDARSLNRYEIATVTADGVKVSAPRSADTNWAIAHLVRGYE